MLGNLSVAVLLLAGVALAQLPPKETPGAINPDVTQANIKQTICRSGYTKTIRPAVEYTDKLKLEQMRERGLAGKASEYEEDHLISLEIGGSPTDPRNLWPEAYKPTPGARQKDQVENYLHKQVCAGSLTLKQAQTMITANWLAIYRSLHRAGK